MEPCRQLKEEYDACFNQWFSQKFLKGDHNDEMCSQLLKVYKDCVEVVYVTVDYVKQFLCLILQFAFFI